MSQRELALRHPIEDDVNASLTLASILGGSLWRELEGLPLEPKHRAKTGIGWLGATCVLGVAFVCLLPTSGTAQDATSGTSAPKETGVSTATPKKQTIPPQSRSKASSSSAAKTSSATPSPARHTKSSSAAAARNSKTEYVSSRKGGKKKPRGQQKIDSERAQAIQTALIREHYMTGAPTGTWNQASEDAMRRYQADHGWQSKQVPDSRALISLGLGPSNDHLLNPESAMTSAPTISHAAAPVSSPSQTVVSHGADPGAHMSTSPVPSSDPMPVTSSDHDASSPQ